LGHRGLGNSSQSVRPIVYVTYARATQGKEFRDSVNFSRKRYHKIGLLISESMTREERKNRRKRSIVNRLAEGMQRIESEVVGVNEGIEAEVVGVNEVGIEAQVVEDSEVSSSSSREKEIKRPRMNEGAASSPR
jgi:hypothetical protein